MRDNRGALLAVGVVAVALLGVVLIGGPSSDRPLDPRSHTPAGTSAVVALAEELGADVDIRVRELTDETDTALLLWDQLDGDEHDHLRDWVRDGGVLVVTDPVSTFSPPGGGWDAVLEDDPEALDDDEPVEVDADECDIPPFEEQGLSTLSVWGGPVLYAVGGEDQSCFGDGDRAYVVAMPLGQGTVVAFGGSGSVVNRTLDEADNAPAIAGLLAPGPGTRSAVLDLDVAPLSEGDETITEVMPTWAKRMIVQLAIAFLVYALWRARRLGKPVAERHPVKVAASELVAAVGGLLERSGSPQHAADVLRAELRRDLVTRLGLPPNLPPATFAQVVAARTQLDEAQLTAALGPGPVNDDGDLLTVVTLIDFVRKEVFAHVGS